MAKYIIDVPDEAVGFMDGEMSFFVEPKIKDERRRHYVLRIDEEDVSIYTEPDRKAIEDEVWGLVGVIANMDNNDYGRVFGCIGRWTLLSKKTYQEVKAKYDAWKKQKEEIHVGDEVRCMDRVGIVVRIDSMDGGSNVVWGDGATAYIGVKDLTKTGRHFNEVEKLLERMREE